MGRSYFRTEEKFKSNVWELTVPKKEGNLIKYMSGTKETYVDCFLKRRKDRKKL